MCGGTYWVQDIAIRQLVGRGQWAGQHGQNRAIIQLLHIVHTITTHAVRGP